MRAILICAGLLVASNAVAAGLPEGTFAGTGRMRTQIGMNTTYSSKLVITGNQLEAIYDYGGGRTHTYTATIDFTGDHYFKLMEGTEEMGTGYMDEGMVHMDITSKNAEETLYFEGTTVKRVGSMMYGAVKLIYTETLTAE